MTKKVKNGFIDCINNGYLKVIPWGHNSIRVIANPQKDTMIDDNLGIENLKKAPESRNLEIIHKDEKYIIINDDLSVVYEKGKLTFYNKGEKILEEFSRKQSNVRRTIGIDEEIPITHEPSYSENISPRLFKKTKTGYFIKVLFEGNREEKIYGMGGYQENYLNKNGNSYELMQRNSQTSVPFYLSSLNYGFIWNNASIGEVMFGFNKKTWILENSNHVDYIVTVGSTPKEILQNYAEMAGHTPAITSDILNLWQSKLRYRTTNELQEIASEYQKRDIPLGVLVIDFYHWPNDGDFKFDMNYWKDIDRLAMDLKNNGTNLMVSLWPTVSKMSENYSTYNSKNMLIQNKGTNKKEIFNGLSILDFTNPLTRRFINTLLKNNYNKNNVFMFWADQAEPEMDVYDHQSHNVFLGSFEKIANKYPLYYIKTFFVNDNNIVKLPILIRSAWMGSQKYGALSWSGDIDSSFDSLKRQIQFCISMGISGIPWCTSDIGGFHSGDSTTNKFRELLIRWFQFATFSPILRMHGDRQPHSQRLSNQGGGLKTSGAANEIWSYGKKVEKILSRYIKIRSHLIDYLLDCYEETRSTGVPIIRAMFINYPNDNKCWEDTLQYMLGSDILVAPITEFQTENIKVYLPKGNNWIDMFTGEKYQGGQYINKEVNIENIPIFYIEKSKYNFNKVKYIHC